MESFPIYKLPEPSKPELFVPPPYCRKAEDTENGKLNSLSLNLIVSNPAKLLLLYETLIDKSSKALEVKLNNYLMKESQSKCTFLLHFCCVSEEAFIQTLGKKELESTLRFHVSKDVITHLIKYKDEALLCDESKNSEIYGIVKEVFNNLKYTVVSIPITKKENIYPCSTKNVKPVLLTCFLDSQKNDDYLIKLSNELFKYCLPVLTNILKYEQERNQKMQYQNLFTSFPKIFASLDNINGALQTLKDETRKLTKTKHCSLYLTDAKIAELINNVLRTCPDNTFKTRAKITTEHEIPDHVSKTGQILNSRNNDSFLADKDLTACTGFETTNLLCFPIRYEDEIIGAVQLCNKFGGKFVSTDEEYAKYLSILYGIALSYSLKFSQIRLYKYRDQLANKMLTYHIKFDEDEVRKTVFCPFLHFMRDFDEFNFTPRLVLRIESVCYVLKMFETLGFLTAFPIDRVAFVKFMEHIKAACRKVPYHNWMHLFSTAHAGYLFLKNFNLLEDGYITQLEGLAYFIACACHDIDYRGVNNPFQQEINNGLITLYSSAGSFLARYKLSQVFQILNIDGCNFLEYFDYNTYGLFLNLLKDFILAFDLTTHFKFVTKQCTMIQAGYNKNNPEHRYLFATLLITAADLSDFIKEWSYVKESAIFQFEEFFTVGELDSKQRIHFPNIDAVNLADLQIEFLKNVCLPVYKMLSVMFPTLKPYVFQIKRHIFYWECSKHVLQKSVVEGISPFELLVSEEFDRDIEVAVDLIENPPSIKEDVVDEVEVEETEE